MTARLTAAGDDVVVRGARPVWSSSAIGAVGSTPAPVGSGAALDGAALRCVWERRRRSASPTTEMLEKTIVSLAMSGLAARSPPIAILAYSVGITGGSSGARIAPIWL